MNESFKSFLLNALSVILGIVITFTVQGMIDRSSDKADVRSALFLVRAELAKNMEDIDLMSDYLVQERESASYLISHMDDLSSCPDDSINYHRGIIFADARISVSQDALELLKSSSLFQKMRNNTLSMKIIRAYDTCGYIAATLNHHLESRDNRFENSITPETAGDFATFGSIDIVKYLQTDYGLYAVRWLTAQGDPESFTDVSDVEDAINAINKYLSKRRNR